MGGSYENKSICKFQDEHYSLSLTYGQATDTFYTMKRRKLLPRFRIRYFRDDNSGTLWRWQSGKMMRNNGRGEKDWEPSVRIPHGAYADNFKEIKETVARQSFKRSFMTEEQLNFYEPRPVGLRGFNKSSLKINKVVEQYFIAPEPNPQ
jgi:hypothetical protein